MEVIGPNDTQHRCRSIQPLGLAFFAVAVIGVAIGTYAAVSLKRQEIEQER